MQTMKNRHYIENLIGLTKGLGKTVPPAEKKLWEALQKIRPGTGIKFRKHKPIGPYIASFYCPFSNCIVEIDGPDYDHTLEKEKIRYVYMRDKGYEVLRFTEKEILENCEEVVAAILSFCAARASTA
jgi:very-short-patch-repair endonuclease